MSWYRLVEPRVRLLSGLFLLLAGTLPAQTTGATTTKFPKEARKALAAAGRLARVPKGSDSRARTERLEKAYAAFANVERRFPASPTAVAEAAFRQGQVLGRLARTKDALAAFERSAASDSKGFGARALLESGHLQRRQKLYPDAAISYRRAIGQKGGRYSDRARLWLGKTLVRLGRIPDARTEWQELGVDTKADAYVRIQAFDDLAMSYVREKRIGEAKRVIEDAEDALASEVSGESKSAKALRGSLSRMRAKKSIAKREKTSRAKRR